MKKLSCILLVDDSEANNFYNQVIIKDEGISEHIAITTNGLEALDYLKKASLKQVPFPELIVLDINMPKMDGFAFLEEYGLFTESFREKIIVISLSSSSNPADMERVEQNQFIHEFRTKPLSKEALRELMEVYFSGRL